MRLLAKRNPHQRGQRGPSILCFHGEWLWWLAQFHGLPRTLESPPSAAAPMTSPPRRTFVTWRRRIRMAASDGRRGHHCHHPDRRRGHARSHSPPRAVLDEAVVALAAISAAAGHMLPRGGRRGRRGPTETRFPSNKEWNGAGKGAGHQPERGRSL